MVNQGESITIDGQEYLCADKIALDGKQYLYLVTASDSIEFCFAEPVEINGQPQVRIIGDPTEKRKILAALKSASAPHAA